MLNQVVLVGRLTKDVEAKELEDGKKVTNVTLAIPRSFKNSRADKINTARENLSKYTYGDIYNILYGNK